MPAFISSAWLSMREVINLLPDFRCTYPALG